MKHFIIFFVLISFFSSCKREYKDYTYYPSGKLKEEVTFASKKDKEEKRNYSLIAYYENGHIWLVQKVKDKLLEDDYWEYYENGQLKSFKMYNQSVLNGILKEYSMDGIKEVEALFLGGVQVVTVFTYIHGDTTSYYYHMGENTFHYGFLSYDVAGKIIEDASYGCEIVGKDTVREGEPYAIEVRAYTQNDKGRPIATSDGIKTGKGDAIMKEVIFGQYDSTLNLIDSLSSMRIEAENNKAIYSFRPTKLGYNFIIGIAYLQSPNDEPEKYAIWPVFKLFYVKGKNEQ